MDIPVYIFLGLVAIVVMSKLVSALVRKRRVQNVLGCLSSGSIDVNTAYSLLGAIPGVVVNEEVLSVLHEIEANRLQEHTDYFG